MPARSKAVLAIIVIAQPDAKPTFGARVRRNSRRHDDIGEARVGQKGRTGYVWWQRGDTPRGLRDVGHQSAWIIGVVCPTRDTGVALVMTRLDTAAMNVFLAELGQAPGRMALC
jgi:hypothetical protein